MNVAGISAGGLAFIIQIIVGILAIANVADERLMWIALAFVANAAGNLLGGVRTGTQTPLEVRIVTSNPQAERVSSES